MFSEMATSNRCSVCSKELGPMHCTGCDAYFCKKDFKIHCEGMLAEMDKIVEERNHLQDEINKGTQDYNHNNPLIDQINKWRDITIEKVKQVAAQVCQEAIQLLNSKRPKINTEFKGFSEELAHLKETENYVEHDLARLNQKIDQFKQDLKQLTQPSTIKLYTEKSDGVDWNRLIYVKEEQDYVNTQQQQQQPNSKLIGYFFLSDYFHPDLSQMINVAAGFHVEIVTCPKIRNKKLHPIVCHTDRTISMYDTSK
jgi:hypothetical protein